MNGLDGVVLSFEKQSAYATAEATDNISQRFEALEESYPGLKFVSLMNQGDYIYLIVNAILKSLALGAVFAILILYLFLRDLRPTFITLCSIPISVVFAIVLMYFSGVTLNMISLPRANTAKGLRDCSFAAFSCKRICASCKIRCCETSKVLLTVSKRIRNESKYTDGFCSTLFPAKKASS